jgi:hypothetical protein
MGSDKRSVSTDALDTLGTIIDDTQKRDAIHLAVEPVIADERLLPGDHVAVKGGKSTRAKVGEGLGIVDPFLTAAVEPGQRFWFVMYPRQVRSLRHVWTHPAFPDDSRSESERYLDVLAAKLGATRERLIEAAIEYVDYDEYWIQGGRFEGEWIPDDFWPHFEAVTGRKVDEGKRGSFLSCSC